MEASTDVSTAELTGVLPTATQSTNRSEQQTAIAHNTQGPIDNSDIRNAVSATMGDIVDDHLPPASADASDGESSAGSPSDQSIEQADNYSHPAGIFVDINDDDTAVESDGDAEVDVDDRMRDYPQTRQTIAEHLSIQGQQTFTSLDGLLSSHNAPGRGLYKIEQVFREKRRKAADLEEDIRCLQAQLDVVSELRDQARTVLLRACVAFSDTRGAAGISDELWTEYEAFCESLESNFGSRDGWSVTCFHDHHNSYVQWDPYLDLFKDTAEMPLGDCNFRCEAATITKNGSTEYVVEFWPLFHLEPREGTAQTWEQQYPKLYKLAKEAVHNSLGDNTVAQELLLSLPNPNLPFTGGWLFEYTPEPARAKHTTLSRRWSYRRACRIPVDGQQDPPKGYLATTSESDSTTSKDIEMDFEGSESSESNDVDMEDSGSESAESLARDSEEV